MTHMAFGPLQSPHSCVVTARDHSLGPWLVSQPPAQDVFLEWGYAPDSHPLGCSSSSRTRGSPRGMPAGLRGPVTLSPPAQSAPMAAWESVGTPDVAEPWGD